MTFQIIDTMADNLIVDTKPTFRRAHNAARLIEPEPEGRKLGYRAFDGSTRDWRYLVRRV